MTIKRRKELKQKKTAENQKRRRVGDCERRGVYCWLSGDTMTRHGLCVWSVCRRMQWLALYTVRQSYDDIDTDAIERVKPAEINTRAGNMSPGRVHVLDGRPDPCSRSRR